VGIAGLNSSGLFAIEHLNRDSRFQIVDVSVTNPAQANLIDKTRYRCSELPIGTLTSPETNLVFINQPIEFDAITDVLRRGKHVVCSMPWMFSAEQWTILGKAATSVSAQATISGLIRWSSEFAVADSAIESHRLGWLNFVRMSCCEKSIPHHDTTDMLTVIGFERLFQLVSLIEAAPRSVYARSVTNLGGKHTGFLATIAFAEGCVAQLEINIDSRWSLRTGWMLEGSAGSFRNERLYTTADDGEIVDEPFAAPAMPAASFGDEVLRNLQPGESNNRQVDRIIRSRQLMEAIESSMRNGLPVDLG